jgi:isoleucyl-tRNA synthetase
MCVRRSAFWVLRSTFVRSALGREVIHTVCHPDPRGGIRPRALVAATVEEADPSTALGELLYQDYKATWHCPRCGTSLSEHEVALGSQDEVDDPSMWVRFRHRPSGHPLDPQLESAAFLVWTTTPWTLPANSGLAVNPEADDAVAERETPTEVERLVVARERLETPPGNPALKTVRSFRGHQVDGLRCAPLFFQLPASETENLSARAANETC